MNDTAMTPAERQKARRDRLKRQGFTSKLILVHTEDQARLNDFIETLRKPETHDHRPDQ